MYKLGLIGKHLSHSFSKKFFEKLFIENSIDGTYDLIEIDTIEKFQQLKEQAYIGFNVTIPYKETIIPYLDELSTEAKAVEAVNTVVFENGKWVGYNTDIYGFASSVKPFLTNKHERALIFGTGGAAKAVKYALENIGVNVSVVSRDKKRADFSYDEVNNYMLAAFKLIINATPVGMFPNETESLNIPYEFLTDEHLAVDLIYNPEMTQFLQKCKKNHATILNGESMLRLQALKAWEIWKNVKNGIVKG